MAASDDLPFSPAAERNAAPILQVLRDVLPATARVLEVASGTGQHAAHFARAMPAWQWQPSEGDAAALGVIAARCAGLPNVARPLQLDVLAAWPAELGRFDAVFSANMLHISPWATCAALMRGAAARLQDSGLLVVYGPFVVDGTPTAASNVAFDASLRARDAAWGLRRLADVAAEALAAGLVLDRTVAMPANNLTLVFRRREHEGGH
jgi:SAM-dependent methyltransferase